VKKFLLVTVALAFCLGGAAFAFQAITGEKIFCCPFDEEEQEGAAVAVEVGGQDPCPSGKKCAENREDICPVECVGPGLGEIDVDFDNAPLAQVMKFLGESGLNYVYSVATQTKFKITEMGVLVIFGD
jgi:hypothetical protein